MTMSEEMRSNRPPLSPHDNDGSGEMFFLVSVKELKIIFQS